MEENPADRVADHVDRVERFADSGQRCVVADKGRRDMQFQPLVRQFGHRQELDRVAQLVGETDIGRLDRVDSHAVDCSPVRPGAERQMREDRQFLGRVRAIDVHCWVGFRVAKPLRLGNGRGIVGSLLFHPRENKIARPVEDRVDRLDPVGRQRLADRRNDRNPAGNGRFEGD